MPFVQLGKINKIFSAIAPFICLAGIVLLQSQQYKKSVQKLNRVDYLAHQQEQARLLEFQRQTPTLGFDNLVANWSYLNFVQYFGDKNARDTIGYQLVPEYFETITQIDPRFTQAHLRLSIANSMYAGYAEETVTLMERVLEQVNPESPDSALLWTSKGLDELLFLGNKEAAIDSYKVAAQWADLTNSDKPYGTASLRADSLTIKNLEQALESTNEIDLKLAQIRAWSSVLVHIKDRDRKSEIIDKISDLKAELLVLEREAEVSN